MMNQLRLRSAFTLTNYQQATGLDSQGVEKVLNLAQDKQLINHNNGYWQVTTLGHRYLNNLLEMFL